MANPYFFGGPRQRISPLQAAVGGLQTGLTLRQMMMQQDTMKLQQQKLEEEMRQRQALQGMAAPYLQPREQLAANPAAQPGFNPSADPEAFPHELYATETRQPTLQDIATGLAIRSGNPAVLGQIMAQQNRAVQGNRPMYVGPGGAVYDVQNDRVLFENPAIRRPPADVVNRIYQDTFDATGDPEAALAAAAAVREKLSRAGGAGAAQGKVDVQVKPEARQGAANVASGTASGRRQIEAEEKLKDIAALEEIVDDAKRLSGKLNTAAGGAGRFVKGAENYIGGITQYNTDAADLQTLRDSYSLALARSVLSERGVLTNQDRSYATNTLPSVWDSKAVAERKIARMEKLTALQREAEEALAAGGKFDVSDFRRRWRQAAGVSGQAAPTAKSKEERLKALGFD